MPLSKENLPAAAVFVTGGLWQDYKRALNEKRPPFPLASEKPENAVQAAFLRRGFELCMEAIESLPREVAGAETPPFPTAIFNTED